MRVLPLAVMGVCLALPIMVGCASMSVTPLTYNGQPKNEAPGIRYYMPKPYLLVTQIPASKVDQSSDNRTLGETEDKAAAAGAAGKKPADTSPSASPSSTSDMSYQLGNSVYLLKLIYLPDMSKTMAINLVPGIFGTSSISPTLQNGWMLTSMTSSADNSKALDDLTTLATALVGGGAKGGAGTAAARTATKLPKGEIPPPPPPSPVLPPGLYEFRYDQDGHLTGLCAVTTFSAYGPSDTNRCPTLEKLASANFVKSKY